MNLERTAMLRLLTISMPRYAIRSALAAVTLGSLLACGGGGGDDLPPFEAVTINGITGVRDNSTELVWARQLGINGLPSLVPLPTAADALYYADRNTLLDDPLFGFLEDLQQVTYPYVVVAETNDVGSRWVVDLFERPGRLSKVNAGEALASPPGYYAWYKLSEKSQPRSQLFNLGNGTVSNAQGLVWALCTVGATWDGGGCDGTPTLKTFAEAQDYVEQMATQGWRMPTKGELQDLLQLTNNASERSLMRPPFLAADAIDTPASLPYWTSSVFRENSVWVVNFSAQSSNGGINTEEINLGTSADEPRAFVRLVRGPR